jgi:hypothetical protein
MVKSEQRNWDITTNALLSLHYDNGQKSYEMQQAIQPGDQMWVNVAELIRSRTPDRKGNLLPVDLSYGTFDLRDLTPANDGLLISSVALDMTMGYNATQPCVECCGFLADSPTFDPYPAEVVVDGIEQTGIEAVSGCSDDTIYISSYFTTWGSLNSSIAAVTAKKVQGVSPGYTTGTAQGTIPTPGSCVCTFYAATPSEPVTVTPQITGISPPRGLIGSSLGVTISGSGFNSPSVSAGSGVSVTINSYTSTQIQATFAITSTASGGNQSVTVTSGGESSPSANFYVQIPETQVRDSGYGSSGLGSLVTITNGNVVDIYGNTLLSGECGVYRDIAYFLDDQETPAQTIQGNYTLVENFTNYSTDVSGLTAPTTQDNPIVYAQTMLGDTQFFGTKASSGCPGANDHESFDQGFTVQIDSSHSYGLSMVNSISRGYYSGAATVNVTVITP